MKILHLFVAVPAVMAVLPLPSCCPCRRLATSTSDSLRIETRVRREFVRDTMFVALPGESARVVVRDTVSHLETSLAESDARINPDGSLTHTLSNRTARLPVGIERETVVRDSIVWRDRTIVQKVEVARPLTRWQRLQMRGFWVLLAMAVLLLMVAVKKF